MADLRDSLLRTILREMDEGRTWALVAAGSPWRCCEGAQKAGPAGCSCWTPEFDLEQTTPDLEAVVDLALGQAEPPVRHRMCGDCAYRPDSPERSGDPAYRGDGAQLEQWAADGDRFWCHDGMRRPIAWRHPAGMRLAAALDDGDYQPPILEGIPYRADGQPGLLCAGWAARNRALKARAGRSREDVSAAGTPNQSSAVDR